jgi:thioredoxin reductase (NADPH)
MGAFDHVILATGGTALPNLLHVPGENLPHVSHYFHDPHLYFNQRLLIVGGRNSAVEAALRCCHAGAKVHMSYRRAGVDPKEIKSWLYPEFASLVQAGAIVGHFNTNVREITPTDVLLASTGGGVEEAGAVEGERLPVDFVLLLTGYRADMSLAAAAGIRLEGAAQVPAFNPRTMETNVPGIYIAGTAIAGSQERYQVFLENCHVHVERIVAHLVGQSPPESEEPAAALERPES